MSDNGHLTIVGILMLMLTIMTGITAIVICHDWNRGAVEKAEIEYYTACETLLDSIHSLDPDIFTDVVMETDEYYSYEVAKERLDSLNTK